MEKNLNENKTEAEVKLLQSKDKNRKPVISWCFVRESFLKGFVLRGRRGEGKRNSFLFASYILKFKTSHSL